MAIKLSDTFNYRRLVLFALPSMVMMVFSSIYSVVDGLFVSNFAGKDALAAVNLVFPLVTALGCIGFMLGTGGAALVAKTMGEGKAERANRLFSFIFLASIVFGIVLALTGEAIMRPFLSLMGAEGELVNLSIQYGQILFIEIGRAHV